ncbi:MAG TPA: class I SAM-dependent methyltransferase [Thermoplasmata archaeon]|nr:class I SAM-dependent methyltransferase [Thermoplasmata archaeon]
MNHPGPADELGPPLATARSGFPRETSSLGGGRATPGNRTAERIRAYYREFDEWGRLVQDPYHRLEFETTIHYLRRYLPSRGVLLDAGGGPGRYTIELARDGYEVVLLDFSPEQLDQARRNVRRAGVSNMVREIVSGSIVDLSQFARSSFDAVLCLGGPLNHVLPARRRETAIGELARVARTGAPIFISVIGRYSALTDGVLRHPDGLRTDPQHHRRILRTGDYDGHRGFAPCHFYRPEDLVRSVRRHRLRVEEVVGLEGLGAYHVREMNRLARSDPEAWASWQEFHLQTCVDPAVVATSEHFLVVARK